VKGKWITNQYDISIRNDDNFAMWGWNDIDQKTALDCMEIVVDVIEENAMACISCERGFPEISLGIFTFDFELTTRLLPLVTDWIGDKSDSDGVVYFDRQDASCARLLLAELEAAADVVRKGIANSVIEAGEPLAVD
jgi:hypothetical protein